MQVPKHPHQLKLKQKFGSDISNVWKCIGCSVTFGPHKGGQVVGETLVGTIPGSVGGTSFGDRFTCEECGDYNLCGSCYFAHCTSMIDKKFDVSALTFTRASMYQLADQAKVTKDAHPLKAFDHTSSDQFCTCDGCSVRFKAGWGCRECDYDVCASCYRASEVDGETFWVYPSYYSDRNPRLEELALMFQKKIDR